MPVAYLVAAAWLAAAALSWFAAALGPSRLAGRLGGHEPGAGPRPPRLGGVVVLFVTVTVGLAFGGDVPPEWRALLPAAAAMYALGLLDDVLDLPARLKFAAQAVICLVLSAHVSLSPIALPGSAGIDLGVFAVPVTAFWLMLVVNAWNMVDGADGLAGGLVVVVAGALALLARSSGNADAATWLAAFAAAHAGFLSANWAPARLYLGDAGSLGGGLVLALAGLASSHPKGSTVGLHTNLLLFWLPLTEMTLTVGRRFIRGQPLFRGDDRHMHHLLTARGLRIDRVVAMLLVLAALPAVAAVASAGWRSLPIALLIAVLVLTTLLGVQVLGYVEIRVLLDRVVRLFRQSRHRGGTLVRVVEASQHVGRAASWPELSRVLQGLVREGVLEEVVLEPRGPRRASPDHAWTLEHDLGAPERPGYALRVRAHADGRGGVRPEDVRAYLVPALEQTVDRLGGADSTEWQEGRA